MVLKPDCTRAVLLKIEELKRHFVNDDNCIEQDDLRLDDLCTALPGYQKEDIFYSLFNLEQAGYVDISVRWGDGCVSSCAVNYMTYDGHEFLESIRDSTHWSLIKKGMQTIRNYSLSAISSLAEGITNAAISSYLSMKP